METGFIYIRGYIHRDITQMMGPIASQKRAHKRSTLDLLDKQDKISLNGSRV